MTEAEGSLPARPAPRLHGQARALCLQIAAEARAEWAYTSEVLARAFRTHRGLGSGERRLVAETVYGLVRWDRRLQAIADEVLRASRRRDPLPPAERDQLLLLAYEARQGTGPEAIALEAGRLVGGPVPAARLAGEDAGLGHSQGLEREALRRSYPSWLLERFVNDLGEHRGLELAEALNRRAPLAVRVNTVKVTRDELAARLAREGIETRPTPLSPVGLTFETRVNAFGLAAFKEGLFEVMDEGSQLVAEAVAPPPRGRVVDACAGAGGKTLALAALLGGGGRLLALDVAGKKLEELRKRARRAGLSNVLARPVEPGRPLPEEARPGGWERVLVDAPCSGLGTLRRNPEARWRLDPREVDAFPARQLGLLIDYAPLVAVGGRLIYATCTLLAAENDRVVERFLAERPGFVPMPLKELFGKARAETLGDGTNLRLVPRIHGEPEPDASTGTGNDASYDGDGFFAAVLRRVH